MKEYKIDIDKLSEVIALLSVAKYDTNFLKGKADKLYEQLIQIIKDETITTTKN